MTTGPGSPGQRAGNRYICAVAGIVGASPLIIPGMPETQDIGHLIGILDGVVLTGARPNVRPSLYGAEPSPAYEPYDQGRDAVAIPLVKSVIRAVPLAECEALYDEIRGMNCAEAIDSHVRLRVAKLLKGAVPREVFDPTLS